jgi:hypothetical protein
VTAHVQAYRVSAPTLTRAQLVLLEGAGEEELTRFVKARARVHGWSGWHVRDSDGVMESVHTLRLDGFCDGLGVPDWYFWHETLKQSFWAELKGVGGRLMPHQKERIASMRKAGTIVMVWYPRDGQAIEHTFRYGLGETA